MFYWLKANYLSGDYTRLGRRDIGNQWTPPWRLLGTDGLSEERIFEWGSSSGRMSCGRDPGKSFPRQREELREEHRRWSWRWHAQGTQRTPALLEPRGGGREQRLRKREGPVHVGHGQISGFYSEWDEEPLEDVKEWSHMKWPAS